MFRWYLYVFACVCIHTLLCRQTSKCIFKSYLRSSINCVKASADDCCWQYCWDRNAGVIILLFEITLLTSAVDSAFAPLFGNISFPSPLVNLAMIPFVSLTILRHGAVLQDWYCYAICESFSCFDFSFASPFVQLTPVLMPPKYSIITFVIFETPAQSSVEEMWSFLKKCSKIINIQRCCIFQLKYHCSISKLKETSSIAFLFLAASHFFLWDPPPRRSASIQNLGPNEMAFNQVTSWTGGFFKPWTPGGG